MLYPPGENVDYHVSPNNFFAAKYCILEDNLTKNLETQEKTMLPIQIKQKILNSIYSGNLSTQVKICLYSTKSIILIQ